MSRPWWRRWLRRATQYSPTRRLAALVALLAPFWLASASPAGLLVARLLTAAVVVLALVDAWRLPGAHRIVAERVLPDTVGLGDEVEGEYRVGATPEWQGATRPWPRGMRALVFDRLPRGVERVAPGVPAPLDVPAEGFAAERLVVRGRVRGVHALGPVALRLVGALGLVRRDLRFETDDRITVTPSASGIRRFRFLALQHRLRDMGVRTVRRRGEGTTFASLREYAVGDDPRHIDWKATARRRKLITREFTVEQGQTVMICIDAGRLMTQQAGPWSRFEYALSSALVLADVAVGNGDRVGVMAFDDRIRAWVPPTRGRAAIVRIREALTPLVPSMAEPDYATAFRTLAARQRKRSLIVIFTDVLDARGSQAVLAYTARSAGRHLPLVVALRNDELVAAAVPRAGASSSAVYESAAAEELLSAREDALARMRRAGVSVLDVSPQRMTAALINRYLEIKARASL